MSRIFCLVCAAVLMLSGCGDKSSYQKSRNSGHLTSSTTPDFVYADGDPNAANADVANTFNVKNFLNSKTMYKPAFEGADKLVSINIDEGVSVKDAILEISRIANIDVNIDPAIGGNILLKMTNRKLKDVFEEITENANVRYFVKNGIIVFKKDDPYIRNYQVDFLNVKRSVSGSFDVDTNSLGSGGASGTSAASGSSSNIKTEYKSDTWEAVKKSLKIIMSHYSTTSTVSAQSGFSGQSTGKEGSASKLAVNSEKTDKAAGNAGAANAGASNEEASKQMASMSEEGGDSQDEDSDSKSILSINQDAGIITIFARDVVHKDIVRYLKLVKDTISAQVLIEARVVEVNLTEDFAAGIDWGVLDINSANATPQNKLTGTVLPDLANSISDTLQLSYLTKLTNYNITNTVKMLHQFGDVKTISSPRVNAANNQQAIITFVKNYIYFESQVQEVTPTSQLGNANSNNAANDINRFTVSSTIKTVPIGVVLSIQPSINIETGEIVMNIRPTISRVVDNVKNPATEFAIARFASSGGSNTNISSNVPVVEIRSLDSIVRMNSGDIVVLGGLREIREENQTKVIPILHRLPILGHAFKSAHKTHKDVETVILIKSTILKDSSSETEEYIKYF